MAKTNTELQADIKSLSNDNVKIIQDNSKLIKDNLELQSQIEMLQQSIEEGFDESVIVVSEPITRTDIIKSMLPQIRLQHARPDTQSLMRSVDEILSVINA